MKGTGSKSAGYEFMKIIILFFIAFIMSGCDFIAPKYNCTYYPEGISGDWIPSGIFDKKFDALDWCDAQMQNATGYTAECECGKNCKQDSSGLQVCKETF